MIVAKDVFWNERIGILLAIFYPPQISYAVCTGTGKAHSPVVQNSSLKRLPTISADNNISSFVIEMILMRRQLQFKLSFPKSKLIKMKLFLCTLPTMMMMIIRPMLCKKDENY